MKRSQYMYGIVGGWNIFEHVLFVFSFALARKLKDFNISLSHPFPFKLIFLSKVKWHGASNEKYEILWLFSIIIITHNSIPMSKYFMNGNFLGIVILDLCHFINSKRWQQMFFSTLSHVDSWDILFEQTQEVNFPLLNIFAVRFHSFRLFHALVPLIMNTFYARKHNRFHQEALNWAGFEIKKRITDGFPWFHFIFSRAYQESVTQVSRLDVGFQKVKKNRRKQLMSKSS